MKGGELDRCVDIILEKAEATSEEVEHTSTLT